MTSRTKFILLWVFFSLPFIASTVTYLWWRPQKTSNYGELISPVVPLPSQAPAVFAAGAADPAILSQALKGRWLMLTVDSGHCDKSCPDKLVAMQKARLILGREQERVLRVVLVDDGVPPSDQVVSAYAGTVWLSATQSPWLTTLSSALKGANVRDAIIGVDPLGNIFIRYNSPVDIQRMSRDFQRVLKASQIG